MTALPQRLTLTQEREPVYCPAGCEHGGGCSLTRGHRGDHETIGATATTRGGSLCVWPRDADDPGTGEVYRARWVTEWFDEVEP